MLLKLKAFLSLFRPKTLSTDNGLIVLIERSARIDEADLRRSLEYMGFKRIVILPFPYLPKPIEFISVEIPDYWDEVDLRRKRINNIVERLTSDTKD